MFLCSNRIDNGFTLFGMAYLENSFKLSVCITSYNRVKELERCLKSIDSKYRDKIEIIVSEDCSPQKNDIREVVNRYADSSPYCVVFNTNEKNLGYDQNLMKLATLASGEYIMYLSDDDCLFPGKLDLFIDDLIIHKPAIAYSAFWYGYEEEKHVCRNYKSSHKIPKGEVYEGQRIYDAILFSGLAFRREYIINIKVERFQNLNYFQVYLFLVTLYRYGGYYQKNLLIDSVSDGENAYGKVDSSDVKNQFLADRESVFSNLEFNKGLFKVIRIFDNDYGTSVFNSFSKEYSLRTFGGLCRARQYGLKTYQKYWHGLRAADVNLSILAYIYYVIIGVFGAKISSLVFGLPKKILLHIRKYN